MEQPPNADKKMTPEEFLLTKACLAFEIAKRPMTKQFDEPEIAAMAMEWRQDRLFNMAPGNLAFGIVTRECRAALKDSQYQLHETVPSELERSAEAKMELMLRIAAYPQIAVIGSDAFRKLAAEGKADPAKTERANLMQDIALLRTHLTELCNQFGKDGGPAYALGELTVGNARRKVEAIANDGGNKLSYAASEILEFSDYLSRKTDELAEAINAPYVKQRLAPVLAKNNTVTVDFANKRTR